MATGLITHEDYLLHDNGPVHPERPIRLKALWACLDESGLRRRLVDTPPRMATEDDVQLVHEAWYVDQVRRLAESGGGNLDLDTPVCPESYRVALLSAGGALAAVDAVLDGELANAFVAHRPPGHHACPSRGMGFCLFNNIAIAARHALRRGLERVLILDWDVHHGNGTQDAFYYDGQVLFCSLHQSPWYPFTGPASETGAGAGADRTLNIPLLAGQRNEDYWELIDSIVAPAVRSFSPELILVSTGSDIHERDPLGGMRCDLRGFHGLARRTLDLAAAVCAGRVVVCLEGGYDLVGLQDSVLGIVAAMLGDPAA